MTSYLFWYLLFGLPLEALFMHKQITNKMLKCSHILNSFNKYCQGYSANYPANYFIILSIKPSYINALQEKSNCLLSSGPQVRILQGAYSNSSDTKRLQ